MLLVAQSVVKLLLIVSVRTYFLANCSRGDRATIGRKIVILIANRERWGMLI
jgi:hypothetical protein